MLIPSHLHKVTAQFKHRRRLRLYKLYSRVATMSLSLHKSQGKDKNLDWVVINSKVWAKALGCDASIIRRDRKFLINNGLIITDGKFNKGVKSLWYRPSILAIGSLVCVDSELYENIRNMNTAVEKRIIENVKKIDLDTAKVLGKLRRDFLSVRLKNNGNKRKFCNQEPTLGTLQTQKQNPTRENIACREITALAVATRQVSKLVAHNKPLLCATSYLCLVCSHFHPFGYLW